MDNFTVPVGSGDDEKEVADVMNHQDENAHNPKVHHVRKEDKKH